MKEGIYCVPEERHLFKLGVETGWRGVFSPAGRGFALCDLRLRRLSGDLDILGIVHVMVRIQMMPADHHRFRRDPFTAGRRRDLPLKGRHIQPPVPFRLISGTVFRRDLRRAPLRRVIKEPLGIRLHVKLPFGTSDLKTAETVGPAELVRPGQYLDPVPHFRQLIDQDLIGRHHPGMVPGRVVIHAKAHILPVEGGAVLKIIHDGRDGQLPLLVDLTVADSGTEGIHSLPPCSASPRRTLS